MNRGTETKARLIYEEDDEMIQFARTSSGVFNQCSENSENSGNMRKITDILSL
jgi:hypothetical protein